MVDLHSNYIGTHIAVPASAPGFGDPDLSGDNCRESTWNAGLGLPYTFGNPPFGVDPATYLKLEDGDALSFHLYPNSNLEELVDDTKIPKYSSLDKMMVTPFKVIDNEVEITCNGCKAMTIDDNPHDFIEIFPNPTTGLIDVRARFNCKENTVRWYLINSYAQIKKTGNAEIGNDYVNFSINMDDFDDGIYWLCLFNNDLTISSSIILNK